MMRWLRFGVLLLVLGFGISPTWAQEEQAMILLRRENPAPWASRYGNLYAYRVGDAAPTPLTTLANVTAPALSPDGSTIAFAAIEEATVEEAAAGDYTFSPDYADPMDMWLMDVDTHEFTRVTQAAANRSNPVWSPDSSKLAWFTWDGSVNGGKLVIYELSTQKEMIFAKGLTMNANDIGEFTLANLVGWGETIAHTVKQGEGERAVLALETVGEAGTFQQVIADTDYLPRVVWANDGGEWVIARQDMDDHWQVVEAETQTLRDLETPPLLQLTTGTGAKLKPVSTGWEIVAADGDVVSIPYEGEADIAPDGNAVVHLRERKAFLWQDGQAMEPLLPDWEIISVIWSPMEWVVGE